jgi:hypothetical protein
MAEDRRENSWYIQANVVKSISRFGLLSLYQLFNQRDKQQHFKICFGLGLFFIPTIGLINSVILISLIGLGKEVFDHFYGSGFCWYDIQANLAGLTLSVLCQLNY